MRENFKLASLTIFPGVDKLGHPETFEPIELRPADVVSLVGPTGAGKSRLLADLEWLACGDTPSQRRIWINGAEADAETRYEGKEQLVAQLSQTMTFLLDLEVGEFLALHAESRGHQELESVVNEVLAAANHLAGESFTLGTRLSALSGGQSRALMIADTAILCESPIVLIDEIENAGIDRRKALALLVGREKIVILATHDPALALGAPRRLVLGGGAIRAVLGRSEAEERLAEALELEAQKLEELRYKLRHGQPLPGEV